MPQVTAHPASQAAIDPSDLPLALRATRLGFRLLRRIRRPWAVRLAGHLFVQPRRHAAPAREVAVLERGERFDVDFRDKRIACWRWGASDAPRGIALLVHGWEARGGQLGSFVGPLVDAGFLVVAFDHVGHGASDGKRCALPTMRDTVRAVATACGPEPSAIVAHSMGSFATSLLLAQGWREARVVYVAPPDDLLVYFSRYLDLVTGGDDLLPELIRLMEARFGEKLEDFRFRTLVETLDQPLLVLHSTDDSDVPIEAGRYVASHWAGARIQEFDGLGHRRILKNRDVVAAAVRFLAEAPASAE